MTPPALAERLRRTLAHPENAQRVVIGVDVVMLHDILDALNAAAQLRAVVQEAFGTSEPHVLAELIRIANEPPMPWMRSTENGGTGNWP